MADPQDTTKADQAARARQDAAVAKAAAAAAATPDAETEGARQRRLATDKRRAQLQIEVAAEAVKRHNAGDCDVVLGDDDGPGTGDFCGGKLGHEGDHAP